MNKYLLKFSVVAITFALSSPAYAAGGSGKSFNSIAASIINNINTLPGLISGISYLLAILFAVLGILKIKDHVENPQQTDLKDGAIRLAAGGALFALPIILQAMLNLIGGEGGSAPSAAKLNKITLGV